MAATGRTDYSTTKVKQGDQLDVYYLHQAINGGDLEQCNEGGKKQMDSDIYGIN